MSFLGLNSDVRPLSLPLQPSMYSHCNKGQMIAFIEVNARNKAFQNKVSIFLGLCSSYFATIIEWLGYLIDIKNCRFLSRLTGWDLDLPYRDKSTQM